MRVDETCRLSGYGVRQPLEQKKNGVPRTPNPTYGMWLGCRARLSDNEYFHNPGLAAEAAPTALRLWSGFSREPRAAR
jgi:hypothetical protein